MSEKYDVIDNRACFAEDYPYCYEDLHSDRFEEEEESFEDRIANETFTREEVDEAKAWINTYHNYQCVGKMIAAIHLLHTLDDSFEDIQDELDVCINHEFDQPCVRNILLQVLYGIDDSIIQDCPNCKHTVVWVRINVIGSTEPEDIGICTNCYNYIPPTTLQNESDEPASE